MAISTSLDYVQRALGIIDADNISEISDSVEGTQVFGLLKNVYDELLDGFPWPHLREFQRLQVTADLHIMKLQPDTVGFKWIRYNKKDVIFIDPLEMQKKLDARDTTLDSVDSNGALNDRDPSFWSSIDDENITFDSYNVSLTSALSRYDGIRKPADLTTDTSRPDIPERMEHLLRNMLFEQALLVLKADETRAADFTKKIKSQSAKLKRWAKRHDRNDSWFGRSYGRRNTSFKRGRTVKVIEG